MVKAMVQLTILSSIKIKKINIMKNVVVVGSQWGDEGKGKIVDWLIRPSRYCNPISRRSQCWPHISY